MLQASAYENIMKLKQINLSYHEGEDRTLMRISTHDGLEYRAWLTRRIVERLVPALDQIHQLDHVGTTPTPEAREEVHRFRQKNALDQAKFSPDYENEALKPAHEGAPILVFRLKLQHLQEGQYLLHLWPVEGDGLQLRLNEVLLQALRKLLIDTQRRAGWNLFSELVAQQPDTVARPEARRLN